MTRTEKNQPSRINGGTVKYTERTVGDVVILDIEGKIILGDGDVEIKAKIDDLLNQGYRKFVLNLAKVPYIDSRGLRETVWCSKAARKAGGRLKLLNPSKGIIEFLTITKLLNEFEWFQEEEAVLKSFEPTQGRTAQQ